MITIISDKDFFRAQRSLDKKWRTMRRTLKYLKSLRVAQELTPVKKEKRKRIINLQINLDL